MPKERIGILGGTFNPIHNGHIAMARAAMQSAKLDRVLFLPDGRPPHKKEIVPAEDRYRMVCAAIAKEPGFEPSRIELDRTGITYTVDTLIDMHRLFPKASLYYIIGADTLMQLHSWHEAERLPGMCTFLVCPRTIPCSQSEYQTEKARLLSMGILIDEVEMKPVEISSTAVRNALMPQEGREDLPLLMQEQLANTISADLPVPAPVRAYCTACGLYGLPKHLPEASQWFARLADDLSPKRFAHSLAVADCAVMLARLHGVDTRKAETAALLHDCAKCMPLEDMQKNAIDHHLTDDPSLLENTSLLHSIVGAWQAKQVYGVTDPVILQAITRHTTGSADMSKLDLVVYLADKIEATRASYPTLEAVRALAARSLEKAVLCSMEGTAKYVRKGGKALHPQTLATIAWLKTLHQCADMEE